MASAIEVQADIKALKMAIAKLPITRPTPPSIIREYTTSSTISKSSPNKSRFSRLRAPFRRISSAGNKKSAKIENKSSSTESLVTSKPITSTEYQRDTASDLLALLAPLVSSLQGLGEQLRELDDVDEETVRQFQECCNDLESRIEGFNNPIPASTPEIDTHDLEMRKLLLVALAKKVSAERNSCPIPVNDSPLRPASTVSPALSRSNSNTSNSPFVLHSSDVLGSRRSSTPEPKAIPIGPPTTGPTSSNLRIPRLGGGRGGQLAPYPSFADAGQHVGLSNVFRLGSFQNSLLFSPSPVAVRQPLAVSAARV